MNEQNAAANTLQTKKFMLNPISKSQLLKNKEQLKQQFADIGI